jgi:hypothetical protein
MKDKLIEVELIGNCLKEKFNLKIIKVTLSFANCEGNI